MHAAKFVLGLLLVAVSLSVETIAGPVPSLTIIVEVGNENPLPGEVVTVEVFLENLAVRDLPIGSYEVDLECLFAGGDNGLVEAIGDPGAALCTGDVSDTTCASGVCQGATPCTPVLDPCLGGEDCIDADGLPGGGGFCENTGSCSPVPFVDESRLDYVFADAAGTDASSLISCPLELTSVEATNLDPGSSTLDAGERNYLGTFAYQILPDAAGTFTIEPMGSSFVADDGGEVYADVEFVGAEITVGRATCRLRSDCDDGLFCSGIETCDPAHPDAGDDGCVAGIPVDCEDGDDCTIDTCDPLKDECVQSDAPPASPCEADGDLCTIDECDGLGGCSTVELVLCDAPCPACVGECDPVSGLCPCVVAQADGNWGTDIWGLAAVDPANPYPDNVDGVAGLGVVIAGELEVFMDVTAEIEALCLIDGGTLRVSQELAFGAGGDVTVVGAEGITIEGDLLVAGDHLIDSSAGPVTIGVRGTYKADPNATGPITATLKGASIEILEGPPGDQGVMTLTDQMSVISLADLVLNGLDAGDKGSCTPPDFDVLESATVTVDGDFSILTAGDVRYDSSQAMSLGGNFDNQSTVEEVFEWLNGRLILDATLSQTFEVGGTDLGSISLGLVDNFAMGNLEVASGSQVTFEDAVDNDEAGQGVCTEALYVHCLILRAGSTITLQDVNIYYGTLIDEGAAINIPPESCAALQHASFLYGDVDSGGDVNLHDLICLLDGLADVFNCTDVTLEELDIFPCGGDSQVDLLDLEALLDALSGLPACPAACLSTQTRLQEPRQ